MSNEDLSPQEAKFMAIGCCCCCSIIFVCSAISAAFAAATKFFDSLGHFFQNSAPFILAIIGIFASSAIVIIIVVFCCNAWKFHGYPAPSLPQCPQITGRINQQQPAITNIYHNNTIIMNGAGEAENLLRSLAIEQLPNQQLRIEEVHEL